MYLTTGQVAKRFQLSIRTIRYYNQIGLVIPSKLEDSGRRHYTEEDCLTLQKVVLLKSLSLSLEEIQQLLNEQSIAAILAAHRASLESKKVAIEESIEQTNSLLHLHQLKGVLHWEEILSLVLPTSDQTDWLRYFSETDAQQLQSMLPKLKEDDLLTKRWVHLVRRLEVYVDAGVDPTSEIAQHSLEELDALTLETFGDNPKLIESFWSVRRSPENSADLHLIPVKMEIIEFIETAYAFTQSQ